MAKSYLNDRRRVPDMFLSLDAPLMFEFEHGRAGPERIVFRIMAATDVAGGIVPSVTCSAIDGSARRDVRISNHVVREVEALGRESAVLDTHPLAVHRVTVFLDKDTMEGSRIFVRFDRSENPVFFTVAAARLAHTAETGDEESIFPASITTLLDGEGEYRWFFRVRNDEEDKRVVAMHFPDAAGSSPALLTVDACRAGGEVDNLVIDQAVDRDGRPVYCCPRSRRIDRPSRHAKAIYDKAATQYFACSLRKILPDSVCYFDFASVQFDRRRSRWRTDPVGVGNLDVTKEIFERALGESEDRFLRLSD